MLHSPVALKALSVAIAMALPALTHAAVEHEIIEAQKQDVIYDSQEDVVINGGSSTAVSAEKTFTAQVSAPNITISSQTTAVKALNSSQVNLGGGNTQSITINVGSVDNPATKQAQGVNVYNGIGDNGASVTIRASESIAVNVFGQGNVQMDGVATPGGEAKLNLSSKRVSIHTTSDQTTKTAYAVRGGSEHADGLVIEGESIDISSKVTGKSSTGNAFGVVNTRYEQSTGGIRIGSAQTATLTIVADASEGAGHAHAVRVIGPQVDLKGKSIQVSAKSNAVGKTSSQQAVALATQIGTLQVGTVDTQNVSLEASGNIAYGLLAQAHKDSSSTYTGGQTAIHGKNIFINAVGTERATGISMQNTTTVATPTVAPQAVVGDADSVVTINCSASGEDADSYGISTHYDNAAVEVNGKLLTINVVAEKGTALGLTAMIGDLEQHDNQSKIVVNADQTVIRAEGGVYSAAIQTTSQGLVQINGSLDAQAENVIFARGQSTVEINKAADADKTVVLNGNINFNADAGDDSSANVFVNLANENSSWTGAIVRSFDSAPTEGHFDETNVVLGLSNGAQWTPVSISESEGLKQLSLDVLQFDGGVVNMTQKPSQTVNIDTLKGTGGTINVQASTADGKTFESGTLEIGQVDASQDEAPSLTVQYTGVNADDVKDQAAALASLNASVKLTDDTKPVTKTNVIQEGAVAGAISQEVAADGTTGQIVQAENTKLSAYSSVAALSAFQWRHDMNDLTKRMGELRTSPEGIGSWVRLYGSEQEYGALQAKNTSIQVGSDVDVGMGWKVGAAFSYTDGNATYADGDADNKAYGLGIYGTWMAENGQFVDLIAKYSRLDTDFALNGMNGGFDNNAYSVSAEYGWHLKLGEYAFVEPQAELTYGQVLGDTFTTGNGVKVEQDDFDAFIGRIGVRGGFHFPDNKGVVYVRASVLHDFEGESTAVASLVSDSNVSKGIYEDLGGTWYEVGVGANFNVTDNTYTYVDLEKTSGGEVKENWRWNVGMRYVW